MAALEDMYIVFGAETECTMGLRKSKLVLPSDHGIFIRGKAQLNAKDCLAVENVVPFGGCKSSSNPSTAALMTANSLSMASAGMSGIGAAFCMPMMASGCAGTCTPVITSVEWEKASEYTDIDDEKALMGRCTLTCAYGGIIKITDSGQG